MSLLAEYAITPSVFDTTYFNSVELQNSYLDLVKEVLVNEGIVRSLYGGEWLNQFNNKTRKWHLQTKEMLKFLKSQHRIRCQVPSGQFPLPECDQAWCEEALKSHKHNPLTGIVTVPVTAAKYSPKHPLIASINKLRSAKWWDDRGNSVYLERKTVSYLEHLRLVLECSTSLKFIDPYLDPQRGSYIEFVKILEALKDRDVLPEIEIHRTGSEKVGKEWIDHDIDEWKKRFDAGLSKLVSDTGMKIKVFLWKKEKSMHDRFLISEIIGINAANGFDIGKGSTTWSRLSRKHREKIDNEYDDVIDEARLYGKFCVSDLVTIKTRMTK